MGQAAEESPGPDGSPGSEVSPGPEASPGLEAHPGPEIIEATIVDDPPRPYVAADAATDEWVTVPPAAPGPPPLPSAPLPPGSPLMGIPPLAEAAGAARLRPAGPEPLASQPELSSPTLVLDEPGPAVVADTWDTAPLPPVSETYEGRRRRGRRGRRRPATWLVVLGVVLALSAAIGVPFFFAGGADRNVDAEPSRRTSGPTATAPSGTPTGLPVIPAPSVVIDASPSPSATPSSGGTESATPSGTGTTTTGTTPATPATQTSTTQPDPNQPAPQPFSVSLEAENATVDGAEVRSGVVDFVGDWPRRRDGSVEFGNIVVPQAGAQYRLRIWYVYREFTREYPRRISVIVNGELVHTSGDLLYTSTPAALDVTVTLGSGNNTIRLTHSSRPSPAIDRIEITEL